MKKIELLSITKLPRPPKPPNNSSSSSASVPIVTVPLSSSPPSSTPDVIYDNDDDNDEYMIDEPFIPSSSKRISLKDQVKGIIRRVSSSISMKNSSSSGPIAVTASSLSTVPPTVTAAVTSTAHTTTAAAAATATVTDNTDNTDMDDNEDQYQYYDLPPVDMDDTDIQQSSSSSSSADAVITDTAAVSANTAISRNNRLSQYLMTHTYKEIKEMASSAPRTSASVQRHDHFFKERYQIFCENAGIEPLPFTREVVDTFFWTMCQVYRWTSVENHVVPALKRFHFEKTGNHVSADMSKMLSDAKMMARHSAVNKGNDMRSDPVLYKDLLHIIKTFPAHYPRKAYDVSAYLLAFNTGARVSSIVNVELRDIMQVLQEADGSYLVRITFRKIKNEVTPFTVTVGGRVYQNPHESDTALMDFFNWFRIHLKESFDLDLLTFAEWKLSSELSNSKIWPNKEDAMSRRFQRRATNAGYDPKDVRMTFHSLRSGFLTQTMLNHRHTPDELSSAINRAAAVARWNPSGKAILKYRRDFDETILSSNLVNPGSQSSAAIPDSLTTSEGFHGITVGSPKWNPLANFKGFRAAIMIKLKEQFPFLDDDELKRLGKISIERALHAYGKDDEDIVAEYEQPDSKKDPHFFIKMARHKITQMITDNQSGFNDLVEHFFNAYICSLPAYSMGGTSTSDFIVNDDQMDFEDDQVQASGDGDDDDQEEEPFDFDEPDTDDEIAAQMEHDQIYGMQYHGDDNNDGDDDDDHML